MMKTSHLDDEDDHLDDETHIWHDSEELPTTCEIFDEMILMTLFNETFDECKSQEQAD